jgi:hypothetical protein
MEGVFPTSDHGRARVEPAQSQDASGRQMARGAGHPGPQAARTRHFRTQAQGQHCIGSNEYFDRG